MLNWPSMRVDPDRSRTEPLIPARARDGAPVLGKHRFLWPAGVGLRPGVDPARHDELTLRLIKGAGRVHGSSRLSSDKGRGRNARGLLRGCGTGTRIHYQYLRLRLGSGSVEQGAGATSAEHHSRSLLSKGITHLPHARSLYQSCGKHECGSKPFVAIHGIGLGRK